jgi:hypothetical protein
LDRRAERSTGSRQSLDAVGGEPAVSVDKDDDFRRRSRKIFKARSKSEALALTVRVVADDDLRAAARSARRSPIGAIIRNHDKPVAIPQLPLYFLENRFDAFFFVVSGNQNCGCWTVDRTRERTVESRRACASLYERRDRRANSEKRQERQNQGYRVDHGDESSGAAPRR